MPAVFALLGAMLRGPGSVLHPSDASEGWSTARDSRVVISVAPGLRKRSSSLIVGQKRFIPWHSLRGPTAVSQSLGRSSVVTLIHRAVLGPSSHMLRLSKNGRELSR